MRLIQVSLSNIEWISMYAREEVANSALLEQCRSRDWMLSDTGRSTTAAARAGAEAAMHGRTLRHWPLISTTSVNSKRLQQCDALPRKQMRTEQRIFSTLKRNLLKYLVCRTWQIYECNSIGDYFFTAETNPPLAWSRSVANVRMAYRKIWNVNNENGENRKKFAIVNPISVSRSRNNWPSYTSETRKTW